jgi:hypothetical protein
VLEEIVTAYTELGHTERMKARGDVHRTLRHLLPNFMPDRDNTSIVANTLKFLQLLAEDHSEVFSTELHILFPKLQVTIYHSLGCFDRHHLNLTSHALHLPMQCYNSDT